MRHTSDMMIETDYRALVSAGQDGLPLNVSGGVVVIGSFDGVHRGHQALLKEGRALADALGVPLVALTFAPHPRRFFKPDQPPFLLSDVVLKEEYLRQANVDAVVQLTFDAVLAGVAAEAFIDDVLRDSLVARHVVVGHNFIFGHARGGDVALLQKSGRMHDFGVTAMPTLSDASGLRISSGRIREAVRHGHMATAEELLGRPWTLRGEVIKGEQRSRLSGFPTANLFLHDFIHPLFGVYAGWITVEETGATARAILDIGRPGFASPAPMLEAHLLDFEGDLYGKTLRVAFGDFLRPEQKFFNPSDFMARREKDAAQVREILPNP